MLFGETVAVYCGNHMEHTDTLCGRNAEHVRLHTGAQRVIQGVNKRAHNHESIRITRLLSE
jgi:hypothetical protein